MRARACLLVAIAVLSSCAERVQRRLVAPGAADRLDKRSKYLKAHMLDGSVYVLTEWQVTPYSVYGTGTRFDVDRREQGYGAFTVPIAEVALFETNVIEKSGGIAAMSVITGLSAVVTVACALNPKECFGSCPTFYVTDGERDVLLAEGFSDSVSPRLEASDVDTLWRARPAGREVVVRMTNEALETHVVKGLHVVAVARPAGGRVLRVDDAYRAVAALVEPAACAAAEGDCAGKVRTLDGEERFSETDGVDLATRETVELSFERPPSDGDLALVVGTRQTLLSTFLLYQALAYMGREATAWLAALERGDEGMVERAHGLGRALGGIAVEVDTASGWQAAGEVHETGPIATDVHVVTLPRPRDDGPVRVRLTLTRGHWRLDWLALAALGDTITPVRLAPAGGPALSADAPLVTFPGDEHVFRFRLPGDASGYELFLESRGYYLEWIREEWLADEDQAKATLLLADPARALRELAPAFKRREPAMEDLFWRSRYVRP